MSELRGFIFRDSDDQHLQFHSFRVVDATRCEALDRIQGELDNGSRYELRRFDRQLAPDHVRATFKWYRHCR